MVVEALFDYVGVVGGVGEVVAEVLGEQLVHVQRREELLLGEGVYHRVNILGARRDLLIIVKSFRYLVGVFKNIIRFVIVVVKFRNVLVSKNILIVKATIKITRVFPYKILNLLLPEQPCILYGMHFVFIVFRKIKAFVIIVDAFADVLGGRVEILINIFNFDYRGRRDDRNGLFLPNRQIQRFTMIVFHNETRQAQQVFFFLSPVWKININGIRCLVCNS